MLNHDKELASLGLSPIGKKKMLRSITEVNEIQKGAEQVIANNLPIMATQFNVVSSVNFQSLNLELKWSAVYSKSKFKRN